MCPALSAYHPDIMSPPILSPPPDLLIQLIIRISGRLNTAPFAGLLGLKPCLEAVASRGIRLRLVGCSGTPPRA